MCKVEQPYTIEQPFTIDDDNSADWAINKIKRDELERDRLIAIAKYQIDELNNKIIEINEHCENKTAFLKSCLFDYFNRVPHHETSTRETYKLLSGSLVLTKSTKQITYNDDALLEYLHKTNNTELIKETPKWSEIKKQLNIIDDHVVSNEGEILDDVFTLKDSEIKFNIKY